MKKLTGHRQPSMKDFFLEMGQYCEDKKISRDIYGNGKFLNDFEAEVAEVFGMEAALFLPSGVMAQVIAIKVWGDRVGSKTFACHETCHLNLHEEDSYKELLGFDVELIGEKTKVPLLCDSVKISEKVSSYIYELPMRHLGGDLPTLEELASIRKDCQDRNIRFHIDGARIFEAASFYQCDVKELVAGADSAFLSFYKGFGSTSGSMLFGSKDFIKEAKVWLRRFGGNLFQLYPLMVPAKMQFDKMKDCFDSWTEKAREISATLVKDHALEIIPFPTKTNMFHMYLPIGKEKLKKNCEQFKDVEVRLGVWEEDDRGHSRIEFTVGDGTLELSTKEISDIFGKLLS